MIRNNRLVRGASFVSSPSFFLAFMWLIRDVVHLLSGILAFVAVYVFVGGCLPVSYLHAEGFVIKAVVAIGFYLVYLMAYKVVEPGLIFGRNVIKTAFLMGLSGLLFVFFEIAFTFDGALMIYLLFTLMNVFANIREFPSKSDVMEL